MWCCVDLSKCIVGVCRGGNDNCGWYFVVSGGVGLMGSIECGSVGGSAGWYKFW